MAEVKVPDIGDFSDVPVIEILVSVGDEVEPEDPLITLESEKATMDVPSPEAGTVEEILVSEGDEVSEGDPILRLSGGGGDDGGDEGEREDGRDEGEATDEGSEEGDEEGGREDDGGEGGDRSKAEANDGSEEAGADDAECRKTGRMGRKFGTRGNGGGEGEPVYASPSVRRIARQEGVDLSRVEGTGRKGRITVSDVEAFVEEGGPEAKAAPAAGLEGLDIAPWPDVDHEKHGPIERVELSRIKKISGPNLARNWVYIPHVTHHDEADITKLEAFRKQINSEQDVKVTMVALLIKASVAVLKRYPEFNSSLERDHLVLKRHFHIGFAADTSEGLLVPVIHDADRKGLIEIASELIELSGNAREGKLGPAEMAGATFTISSLGGIGGTGFTPIVNAPQVAILGATRAATKPIWNEESGEFEPRLMLPLSLSYDHRAVDGAAAARFCAALTEVLSDFRRVLL